MPLYYYIGKALPGGIGAILILLVKIPDRLTGIFGQSSTEVIPLRMAYLVNSATL
jgi:hypothetical protein